MLPMMNYKRLGSLHTWFSSAMLTLVPYDVLMLVCLCDELIQDYWPAWFTELRIPTGVFHDFDVELKIRILLTMYILKCICMQEENQVFKLRKYWKGQGKVIQNTYFRQMFVKPCGCRI